MDENYDIKIPSKAGAWALLIFSSIIALVDVYFWLPFFRTCQAYDHNILLAIKDATKQFALFAGIAFVYFVFNTIANIKFSHCRKFWGPSFGNFVARVIIILEYAAYAFAIVALFVF